MIFKWVLFNDFDSMLLQDLKMTAHFKFWHRNVFFWLIKIRKDNRNGKEIQKQQAIISLQRMADELLLRLENNIDSVTSNKIYVNIVEIWTLLATLLEISCFCLRSRKISLSACVLLKIIYMSGKVQLE